MEGLLAEEFADRTGLYCVGAQTLWAHKDHAFARCTLDGFAAESDDLDDTAVLGTVQFKTDGRFGWPDGVPPNIRAQCVWEMGVTGLAMSWLVVMFAGFRIQVYEIPFDDEAKTDWEFMLSTASDFWDHVTTGDPPPPDDHEATTRALEEIHEPDPTQELDATDTTRYLVDLLRAAKANTKAAKATEDALSNELRGVLGDACDLVDGGRVIASWRPQTARRFDVEAFRTNYPDLADVYTNETTSRVLRLHTAKGK
jgi:predicted phage-related endonuclease